MLARVRRMRARWVVLLVVASNVLTLAIVFGTRWYDRGAQLRRREWHARLPGDRNIDHRDKMVDDLAENYLQIGMARADVLWLLGPPDPVRTRAARRGSSWARPAEPEIPLLARRVEPGEPTAPRGCHMRTKSILLVVSLTAIAMAAGLWASWTTASHNPPSRPHHVGHNEGFGNEKVTVFFYPQNFFCTDEPLDDLDGPGHNGDGVVAAQDPDEFQEPSVGPPGSPCIVGPTARGSLPTIDPAGRPIANAEPVWAILPFFDQNRNGVLDVVDPTVPGPASATPVQCPEPGPPFTQHVGPFGTCAMHPSTLHVEPVVGSLLAGVAVPGGHIPLPNHSHIVRNSAVSINPVWWQVISVRVDDERIWPDFNGRCPANRRGGPPCLTSEDALRQAQSRGQAGADTPTNTWLFFDSKEVNPQPASSSGSG